MPAFPARLMLVCMKRIFTKALAILCAVGLLTSCATSSNLVSVPTSYNDVFAEDGESMQVVEDERYLISAEGLSIDDGIATFIVSIGNKGDYSYRFHEDAMEFYGGNRETGEWWSLGTWSADEYYRYVNSSSSDSAAPLFAFLVGVGVLGTMMDIYDGDAYFDLGVALFTTWLLSAALDSGYDDDYYTYYTGDDNLLRDRTIYSHEVYRGVVACRAGEYPDYMIRLHLDGGRPYELVFQRHDRERYL